MGSKLSTSEARKKNTGAYGAYKEKSVNTNIVNERIDIVLQQSYYAVGKIMPI